MFLSMIWYYKQKTAMTDFYEVYPTFDSLLHAPNTLYHALRVLRASVLHELVQLNIES